MREQKNPYKGVFLDERVYARIHEKEGGGVKSPPNKEKGCIFSKYGEKRVKRVLFC